MKLLNPSGEFNLHTHTCSCDGKDRPEVLVQKALALGFTRLGFSGHEYAPYDIDCCMSPEGTKQYREEILSLKEKYRGRIEILLGIERDFFCEPDDFPYDFVIGSVHYVLKDGEYICVDDTVERAQKGVDEHFGGSWRNLVEAYFETVAKVPEKLRCDIVGHFDLVTKFNQKYALFDEDSSWYREAALSALQQAALSRPVFEINTGAMARGYRSVPYPAPFLIEELERMDIPMILSSDCHDAAFLDFGFQSFLNL